MDHHGRKMIAPIIIVIIISLLVISYGALWVMLPGLPGIVRFIAFLVVAAICGGLVYVLILRINEIERGDEDDLSQY